MKKTTMIISICIIMFLFIGSISATDTYNINDIRNLEASIPMHNQPTNIYIDYRDIDEAESGGYIQDENRFVFPHDLGLGKHNMEIHTENGVEKYDFYVVKSDENIKIYDGYTPYYYDNTNESDESVIEEDYNDFIAQETATENIGDDGVTAIVNNDDIVEDNGLIAIKVMLGDNLISTNDSLTMCTV